MNCVWIFNYCDFFFICFHLFIKHLSFLRNLIFRLRDQKEQSEFVSHHREEAMNQIKELKDFIVGQETDITKFDEALVKKLIDKITVLADRFTVEFKSGITIDIEA